MTAQIILGIDTFIIGLALVSIVTNHIRIALLRHRMRSLK